MNGKTILITGCSSGIGLCCAKIMARRGWRVIASARTDDDLAMLATLDGVSPVRLELADSDSIAACAAQAIDLAGGRLDALFNNAAYGQIGAVEDVAAEHLRRQIEVNVIGTHDLTRQIIPSMRKNGAGRIVQCSSVLGLVSGVYRGAYCASKFALEGLSDALRMELEGTGITVSLIEPGPIESDFIKNVLRVFDATIDTQASAHREVYAARRAMLESGGRQDGRLGPEAVAQKLIHACESRNPKPRYFVTKPTYVADVFRRCLPTRMLDRVLRRM